MDNSYDNFSDKAIKSEKVIKLLGKPHKKVLFLVTGPLRGGGG